MTEVTPCEMCDSKAEYVACVAYLKEPPEEELQPWMVSCGTHIGVLLERSGFMPGSTEAWVIKTVHRHMHEIGHPHSHEEGGEMTPVEPDPEVPEEPETPETPED